MPSDFGQGYFYTPEDEEQSIALQRRRAYADALLKSHGTEGSYGGLADAGRMLAGALVARKADAGQRELAKSSWESYAKSMAALLGGDTASASPGPMGMDENGAPIAPPAAAGPAPNSRQSRMAQLMASGDPRLIQQFAPSMLEHQMGREDKLEDRAYTEGQKQMRDLTPDEAAVRGLRGSWQIDPSGALHQVQESDVLSPEALAQKLQITREGRMRLGGGGSGGKSVQSVRPLSDGTLLTVYRDGTSERTNIDGEPVTGAQYDPENKFRMNAAGAGGKSAGVVAESLPTIEATFGQINRNLDAFDDPKVKAQADRSLGAFDKRVPAVAGYNADFVNRLKQIEGQTFLQAFQSLRGAGAITEPEGQKATVALNRMQNAASAEEFYQAKAEAKTVFAEIQAAARQRASRGAVVPQMGGGGRSSVGAAPQASRFKIEQVE
jgi:hypothetical protein